MPENPKKNRVLKKQSKVEPTRRATKNTLLEFFREAPLPDLELDTRRKKDIGRNIDL